jgi:flagellar basal-body rod modification protein FlgD
MTVSSISSTSSVSTTSSSSSATSLNSDDFLKLLVEQLQNQNPLNPTDSNEMLNQMVSYSSYQAQATTNDTLSEIASTLQTIASSLNITV